MSDYDFAIEQLLLKGFKVAKRILVTALNERVLMGLEVEVLWDDKIDEIRKLLPEFHVFKSDVGVIQINK